MIRLKDRTKIGIIRLKALKERNIPAQVEKL